MPAAPPAKGLGLLTAIQKTFLALFSELPDQQQFNLTGDTALAEYYLGHRLSFDLDLFTGVQDLILPTSYQIESACRDRSWTLRVVRRFSSFVEFLFEDGDQQLKIDLAQDSPFRLAPAVPTELGVLVNNYQDLRVDKLLAYFGRSELRDAADLFYILEREPLAPLLEEAAQKDPGFDRYWFAIALNRCETFPDELERWPIKMLKPLEPRVLKRTFLDMAVELMRGLEK
jgi:hypothetical protein